jgi:alcohol dehydrogenase, propanol-preferring
MSEKPENSMKAMVLDRPAPVEEAPLRLAEVPVPEPASDEVLIKISACGICRTDLHVAEGELAPRRAGVIPGHQIVGTVEKMGESVENLALGEKVGVAWLGRTCGRCADCRRGRENLCEAAEFTGWTRDGGFAEYAVAAAGFVYPVPAGFADTQAAPLLCAGIIGYRALKLTNLAAGDWSGARIGIYGFGAAGHVCLQVARARGADVFVATRDRERPQSLAAELGAAWVGDAFDAPPVKLDSAIIFAPAGELVPAALEALKRGATLVLGGIYMSPIPEFEYSLLYGERVVRSVANNTREDGREFLREAAAIPIRTSIEIFPLAEANRALLALKTDAIRGAGVLTVS